MFAQYYNQNWFWSLRCQRGLQNRRKSILSEFKRWKDIEIAKHLKVKDFRMADEQQMIDLLGVERGCATPMALMNDKEKSG